MMLFPGENHEYHALTERWIVSWFTFGGYHIENLLKTIGISSSGIFSISNPNILDNHVAYGLELLQSDPGFQGIDCSVLVYNFIMDLYKFLSIDSESNFIKYSKIEKVFSYIENNYSKVISIDDLAGTVSLSPQYFCNLFKEVTCMRPFEYLNNFRIKKSKMLLLKNPECRLSDIAEQVGYESESYFSTTFKRYEGISPIYFRDMNKIKK